MSKITSRLLFHALLGLFLLALGACGGPTRPADDDDAADDDDDAADDDDDVSSNDDDVLGDDDDDDDDDDDAAGDDDDSTPVELPYTTMGFQIELSVVHAGGNAYGLGGTYTFIYYDLYDPATGAVSEFCRERIEFEAVASFGPGVVADCNNCTGQLALDESLIDHVSKPLFEPTDCDPAWLTTDNDGDGNPDLSWGWAFVTSAGNGGLGDFLNIGLIDYASFVDLGFTADSAGQNDAAALSSGWTGFNVTHFGYVNAGPGSFAEASGLAAVAATAGAGSPYHFYWTIAKDPNLNGHSGTDMVGDYVGAAAWIITFQ